MYVLLSEMGIMSMNERGLGVPSKHKPMGRPKSKEVMITKTYSLYNSDVEKMLDKDLQPKHVFRMGILAITENPQIQTRISGIDDGLDDVNVRIERLVRTLSIMSKEHYAMRDKLVALGLRFEDIQKEVGTNG